MTGLPRLLLIADGFAGGGARDPARVAEAALAAVSAGRIAVQLRDHEAGEAAFAEAARRLVDRLRQRRPETVLIVNAHADVARSCGAGLHAGRRGPALAKHRDLWPLTAAVHRIEEVRAAEGADALVYSPVFSTASKPDAAPAGVSALLAACRSVSLPVYALGGLTPARVAPCLAAGAYGVAVLSGVLDAPDPAAAAHAYVTALADASR